MSDFFVEEQQVSDPLKTTEGIQLPFAAPVLAWLNGSVDMEEVGGAKYFGGWKLSEENWKNIEHQCTPLPAAFKLSSFKGTDGKYSAYLTRWIACAPFAMRKRNIGEGGAFKSHAQILAYMATPLEDGSYMPWGPVMLTAKGMASSAMEKAFKQFEAQTSEIRSTQAGNAHYSRFFIPIGTFGKEPIFTEVGKRPNVKEIAMAQLGAPHDQKWTLETLKRMYIGKDVIDAISTLQLQASEWLNDKDWLNNKRKSQQEEMPIEGDFPF